MYQNVCTYQALAYRLLFIKAKGYYKLFLSCLVTSTSLIFTSKGCATKNLHFLPLEFLDPDWFEIYREFIVKLQIRKKLFIGDSENYNLERCISFVKALGGRNVSIFTLHSLYELVKSFMLSLTYRIFRIFSQTLKKLGEGGTDQTVFLKLMENKVYFDICSSMGYFKSLKGACF